MPRFSIPRPSYTFPTGKPIPLVVTQVVGMVAFLLAARWMLVNGRLGWDSTLVLMATVVVFGVIDHGLLRFYERRGKALRAGRDSP